MLNKFKKKKLPEIYQADSKPYGKSYVKWTEKWWQWAFSIPKDESPIFDKTGKNCRKGQDGPVWFLAGTTGDSYYAERSCFIPGTKSILFPILVSLFSHAEKPAMKVQELIRYTARDIDQTSYLEATIDGITLNDLLKYRIQSYFHLNLVEDNIWDVNSGDTMAASDGFWVFIKPLTVGKHTVNFQGVEPNFKTRVTYKITVS